MPDWRSLASSRLGRTNLSEEEHEAIVTELADHLEEIYEVLLLQGMEEQPAIEKTLQEFGDARQLGTRIYAAKKEGVEMNERTRSFWLPGLVTLTVSMVLLLILQHTNWPLSRTLFHASPPLVPFTIWLGTLPIVGALGTYLSGRAGGSLRARIGAAVFPSIALAGMLVFAWVFALLVEKNPFVREHQIQFALIFLPWVVFPGMALLAGGVFFQKVTTSRGHPKRAA